MWPPRPKNRIRFVELPRWERKGGWVAQRKFDGTRTLIHILPNGQVEAWRPGKQPHLQWKLSVDVAAQIRSLNIELGKEYWLDGELLNNKTSDDHYKNRIVLFDILQAGWYFFGGPNLMKRQQLLADICRNPVTLESGRGIALVVTENIWLAQTFTDHFVDRWNDFISFDEAKKMVYVVNEIEGLVLKQAKSVIEDFGNKEYEVNWQVRCRKPEKGYDF